LEAIPSQVGLPIIAELIQRKKTVTDYEAEKVIRVAQRFEFIHESKSFEKLSSGFRPYFIICLGNVNPVDNFSIPSRDEIVV
jgi:hypothetical protein